MRKKTGTVFFKAETVFGVDGFSLGRVKLGGRRLGYGGFFVFQMICKCVGGRCSHPRIWEGIGGPVRGGGVEALSSGWGGARDGIYIYH